MSKIPDFKEYTLALFKNNMKVYSSDKSGVRPIVECARQNMGKYQKCTLHDKVIGLASARCIVYSGMITSVVAKVLSKPAEKALMQGGIRITAERIVDNILTQDRSSICPMELRALNAKNNAEFFKDVERLLFP